MFPSSLLPSAFVPAGQTLDLLSKVFEEAGGAEEGSSAIGFIEVIQALFGNSSTLSVYLSLTIIPTALILLVLLILGIVFAVRPASRSEHGVSDLGADEYKASFKTKKTIIALVSFLISGAVIALFGRELYFKGELSVGQQIESGLLGTKDFFMNWKALVEHLELVTIHVWDSGMLQNRTRITPAEIAAKQLEISEAFVPLKTGVDSLVSTADGDAAEMSFENLLQLSVDIPVAASILASVLILAVNLGMLVISRFGGNKAWQGRLGYVFSGVCILLPGLAMLILASSFATLNILARDVDSMLRVFEPIQNNATLINATENNNATIINEMNKPFSNISGIAYFQSLDLNLQEADLAITPVQLVELLKPLVKATIELPYKFGASDSDLVKYGNFSTWEMLTTSPSSLSSNQSSTPEEQQQQEQLSYDNQTSIFQNTVNQVKSAFSQLSDDSGIMAYSFSVMGAWIGIISIFFILICRLTVGYAKSLSKDVLEFV